MISSGRRGGLPVRSQLALSQLPHELLVEAGLLFANLVGISCPETGRVRSQNLVAQDDLAVVHAELELGVGDDYAALLRVACSRFVHLDGQVADGCSVFGADKLFALLEADILVVVANLSLRGRGEDGFGQLGRIYQAFGKLNATYSARLLIVLQTGTGKVATHNALDGEHVCLLYQHKAASKLIGIGLELLRKVGNVGRDKMVVHHIGQKVEPEARKLREHLGPL